MEQKQKIALITGITGQDGGYLTELLVEKGYHIYGVLRMTSTTSSDNVSENLKKFSKSEIILNS